MLGARRGEVDARTQAGRGRGHRSGHVRRRVTAREGDQAQVLGSVCELDVRGEHVRRQDPIDRGGLRRILEQQHRPIRPQDRDVRADATGRPQQQRTGRPVRPEAGEVGREEVVQPVDRVAPGDADLAPRRQIDERIPRCERSGGGWSRHRTSVRRERRDRGSRAAASEVRAVGRERRTARGTRRALRVGVDDPAARAAPDEHPDVLRLPDGEHAAFGEALFLHEPDRVLVRSAVVHLLPDRRRPPTR